MVSVFSETSFARNEEVEEKAKRLKGLFHLKQEAMGCAAVVVSTHPSIDKRSNGGRTHCAKGGKKKARKKCFLNKNGE